MQGCSFFPLVMTELTRSSEQEERATLPIPMCQGFFLKIFFTWLYKEINLQNISYPKEKFTIVYSSGKLKYQETILFSNVLPAAEQSPISRTDLACLVVSSLLARFHLLVLS